MLNKVVWLRNNMNFLIKTIVVIDIAFDNKAQLLLRLVTYKKIKEIKS